METRMAGMEVQATPCYVCICSVCGERHNGGASGCDELTDKWVEKHAKWHEHSSLAPPRDILIAPSSGRI
jgi:hypothetical protein